MSSLEPGTEALEGFRRALCEGRVAHAYVVECSDRNRTRDFCETLLQHLLCERDGPRPCGTCGGCRRVREHTHPDVVWVEPESKARQILIERVRDDILPLIQQTPFIAGGWRAAVLLDAECLNPPAANALLKTLEEPSPRVVILLVTADPERLPATVRSRCQRLRVAGGGSEQDVWRERTLEILIALASSRGLLERLGRVNELRTLLDEAREVAEREILAGVGGTNVEGAADVDKDILAARVNARALEVRRRILKTIELWQRDVWVCTLGSIKNLTFPQHEDILRGLASRCSVAQALEDLRGVEIMRRQLERNLPEESVIEAWTRALPGE